VLTPLFVVEERSVVLLLNALEPLGISSEEASF
jgi:hypothetical protein